MEKDIATTPLIFLDEYSFMASISQHYQEVAKWKWYCTQLSSGKNWSQWQAMVMNNIRRPGCYLDTGKYFNGLKLAQMIKIYFQAVQLLDKRRNWWAVFGGFILFFFFFSSVEFDTVFHCHCTFSNAHTPEHANKFSCICERLLCVCVCACVSKFQRQCFSFCSFLQAF